MSTSDCIDLAGVVVQGVIGLGAVFAAFAWRKTYIGKRRVDAMVELVVASNHYVHVLFQELFDWEQGRPRRNLAEPARAEMMDRWIRAKVDFTGGQLKPVEQLSRYGSKWDILTKDPESELPSAKGPSGLKERLKYGNHLGESLSNIGVGLDALIPLAQGKD